MDGVRQYTTFTPQQGPPTLHDMWQYVAYSDMVQDSGYPQVRYPVSCVRTTVAENDGECYTPSFFETQNVLDHSSSHSDILSWPSRWSQVPSSNTGYDSYLSTSHPLTLYNDGLDFTADVDTYSDDDFMAATTLLSLRMHSPPPTTSSSPPVSPPSQDPLPDDFAETDSESTSSDAASDAASQDLVTLSDSDEEFPYAVGAWKMVMPEDEYLPQESDEDADMDVDDEVEVASTTSSSSGYSSDVSESDYNSVEDMSESGESGRSSSEEPDYYNAMITGSQGYRDYRNASDTSDGSSSESPSPLRTKGLWK